MEEKSFQQYYPESLSYCYGCGPKNEHGLHISSYWEGDEAVATFHPETYHLAFPGYVYGGLLASLIDCHCVGTAAAAAYKEAGREPGSLPAFRYVTGSLHVDYKKPTPLGPPIKIRAKVVEIKGRKTVIEATIEVEKTITAIGRVLAVRMPDDLNPESQ